MTPADERRLQRFDAFVRGVNDDMMQIQLQVEQLRAEGRSKSTVYQQLSERRVVLEQIMARLREAGL